MLPSIQTFPMPLLESRVKPKNEPFDQFFKDWLVVQERDLQELKVMVKTHSDSDPLCPKSTRRVQELVVRVVSHYEDFYEARSESIKENVLLVLTPDWMSKLEDAILWIGGWRPTTALHLLYSKVGLQFEARLNDVLSGINTDDLGNLTMSQLVHIDALQREVIKEEKKLTEILASHQESMADSSMVELSDTFCEFTQAAESENGNGEGAESNPVKEIVDKTLAPKNHKLGDILRKADDLRLKTLKNVVDILSPIQAVHFLIADAQHNFRVHELGKQIDEHTKRMQEACSCGGSLGHY